jgi:hypothetical protein
VALGGQVVTLTGFAPGTWEWANQRMANERMSESATLVVTTTGVYTLDLWMWEDGLRVDRLLLRVIRQWLETIG